MSSFFLFLRGAFENSLKKMVCHKITIVEKFVFTAFFKILMEWNGLEWNHGVEWSGMDFSGGCILVILGHFDTFWKIWSEFYSF